MTPTHNATRRPANSRTYTPPMARPREHRPLPARTRAPRTAALLAAAAALPACTPDAVGPHNAQPPAGELVVVNAFSPVELRVHPLTRVVLNPQRGANEIEAHLELIDRFGHTVKALGEFNFSLYRTGGVGDPTEQLMRWSVDLSNPNANAEPYDMVTRTYRLILTGAPTEGRGERGLLLVARFTPIDGATISSTHRF